MKNSILFVDDQEEIISLIEEMLKKEEFEKYFANSAKDALNILENFKIDVVVTDMNMPGFGGLDFLEIIKQKYPQLVRIVLSGHSDLSTILASINRGEIFRYITKPWRIDNNAIKIIYDAFEYSNFLKQKNNHENNNDFIHIDKIKEFFKNIDLEIAIEQNNKIDFINISEDSFNKENKVVYKLNEIINVYYDNKVKSSI